MDFFDKDLQVYIKPAVGIEAYRNTHQLPSKLIYTPFVNPNLLKAIKKRKINELPPIFQGTHLYCIDNEVVFFQGLMGAPSTVILIEQLITLGIKEVLFLGIAGAIQTVKIGDIIIVTEALLVYMLLLGVYFLFSRFSWYLFFVCDLISEVTSLYYNVGVLQLFSNQQ